jgi:hypothetical protein
MTQIDVKSSRPAISLHRVDAEKRAVANRAIILRVLSTLSQRNLTFGEKLL